MGFMDDISNLNENYYYNIVIYKTMISLIKNKWFISYHASK